MKFKFLTFLLCLFVTVGTLDAQVSGTGGRRESVALKYGADHIGRRTDAEMNRWRDNAVGQFIHWGVYAIPGGMWEGRYVTGAGEWIRSSLKADEKKVYDNLYKEFNPKQFDAKAWAKQAKAMGAKYVIFTTKHHDGFCMWPSKYTDYTIANTPYKKDIVKQIVDAYSAEGIDVHLYFSIIDWNHKDYRGGMPKTDEEKESYERFKTFTRNQLLELIENYPKLKGLWFDGSWDAAWRYSGEWTGELNKELRAKKPGIIIGSRFRADELGNRGYDANGDLIGDYDQSWERDLPESYEYLKGVDWDCIMTIAENGWGHHKAPRGYIKSSYNFIELLVQCASMEGNFVLNFGPDEFGKMPEKETTLAKDIGDWVKINGEAIYGTTHANYVKQGWGYYTKKGNKVYMHVFNRPMSNELLVRLPKGSEIDPGVSLLDGGRVLELKDGGRNKKNDRLFYINLPEDYKPTQPFVIVFDLKQKQGTGEYEQAKT